MSNCARWKRETARTLAGRGVEGSYLCIRFSIVILYRNRVEGMEMIKI